MSYESAVVLVIVFSIPAGFLAIIRFIRLRQQDKAGQADLDMIFSSNTDDSGKIGFL